ncbi:5-oxoprolinase subunit PxpA [Vibrio rarus]|uniref:5-oxoprolinase subunit PxpA n=1 Tax=Vibrio rarus TaxID=413403 RepID=UPI0021C26E2B|nr:5-oxoprolinase subunit PxpA [Vibrio rarus]
MKLNCDMGESYGSWSMGYDAQIMPYIHMASIACGFHASDANTMARTVALAQSHNVTIGAHPGYADKEGFGRRSIAHSMDEITHLILYQVGALQGICQLHQAQVEYIKPHGALYNDMMKDTTVFQGVVNAAAHLKLPLMILFTSQQQYLQLAHHAQVPLILEGFADRRYQDNAHLAPRSMPGAVIDNANDMLHQAHSIIHHHPFHCIDNGAKIQLNVDTLCLHGDGANACTFARQLRQLIDGQL